MKNTMGANIPWKCQVDLWPRYGGGALNLLNQLPLVFLPSVVATPVLLNAPSGFDGRLFVAYPTLPMDVTPHGREGYAMLKKKYTLPAEHLLYAEI